MFVSRSFRRYIVLVVVLCLLLLPFPASNLWWREAFNGGHTILFAILSFSVFRQIKAAYHFSNSFTIYLIVLLLGVLFGALTELLQTFVLRSASLNDFYRDVFGLVAGLSLVTVYGLKEIRCRKSVVALLLLVSGSLIVHNISRLIRPL